MRLFRRLGHGLLPAFVALGLRAAPAHAESPPSEPLSEQRPGVEATPRKLPPVPEYDLPPPSARWNLLFTGVAVTGVWYGAALGASFAWPHARTADELRVPIVGPWMALGDTGCKKNDPDCSVVLVVLGAIVTGMDGIGQAGGLGVALESLFLPTARPKRRASNAPFVRPVPYTAGRDGVGLGVVGQF